MYISKVLNLSRLTFINHYSRANSTQVSRQNNTGPQAIEHAELQTSTSLIVIESLKPNPGRALQSTFKQSSVPIVDGVAICLLTSCRLLLYYVFIHNHFIVTCGSLFVRSKIIVKLWCILFEQ